MLDNSPKLKNFFTVLGILATIATFIAILVISLLFISVKKVKNAINTDTTQKQQQITVREFNPSILINNLSEDQKKLLNNFGIDETNIPTSISKEQENCAIKAIGEKRLNDIISGSTPTYSELLKAKSCI